MSGGQVEPLSASVDAKLAEILFNQRVVLFVGSLVPASVAVLAFVRSGQRWFIWWGVVSVMVLAYRLAVDSSFRRRRIGMARPTLWRRRFLIGACANGLNCGIGAADALLTSDSFTQLLVIGMVSSFVMGSAARNGTYPNAAVGSIVLAESPLFLACLARRDVYYVLYSFYAALFTLAALTVVRHIYSQTVNFLVIDEKHAALLLEVGRSNRELATANANFSATNAQLEEANAQLAAIAGTDGLTGVPNRRSFDERFERETCAARREDTLLSVLMFDIDSFKKYNDRYGHQAGDACLRTVARTLANCVRRPCDLLARYGGEEFVAILPQTDPTGAAALAEAMRLAVATLALEHLDSAAGIVTVSIGAVTSCRDTLEAAADLLRRADDALYLAKSSGRNCVQQASDEPRTEVPAAVS